jgi:hypothetical protein
MLESINVFPYLYFTTTFTHYTTHGDEELDTGKELV